MTTDTTSAHDAPSAAVAPLAPARGRRAPGGTRPDRPARSLPAAARAAVGFALLWIPLTLLALATEWRVSWAAPAEPNGMVRDAVASGTAVSGPLPPQLILLALAFGASRGGRLGRAAVALIGVMGALIAFNGVMNAVTESEHAPQAAAVAAGALFAAWGLAMAVRDLRR